MKRRQRILQAVGEVALPEVLVQLRNKLVADAEGFNVHRRQHGNTRSWRGCGGPPESTGRGMQEEIRRRTREAPAAPVGRESERTASRYSGTEGETRTQDYTRAYPFMGTAEPGRRRSTVKGNARRMPPGSLIRRSTLSTGKPCTWGRT